MNSHFDDRAADSGTAGRSERFRRHAETPRNLGPCPDPSAAATGIGSCGDRIHVDLRIEKDRLNDVRCVADGCEFTVACASAVSVLAAGRTLDDALILQPEDVVAELGDLPDDHLQCARLAVNTLGDAIAEYYRLALGRKKAETSSECRKGR